MKATTPQAFVEAAAGKHNICSPEQQQDPSLQRHVTNSLGLFHPMQICLTSARSNGHETLRSEKEQGQDYDSYDTETRYLCTQWSTFYFIPLIVFIPFDYPALSSMWNHSFESNLTHKLRVFKTSLN